MKHATFLWAAALAAGLAASADAAPVLDGGWDSDVIFAAATDSVGSPYGFTLTSSAWFRITDAFAIGDQFQVFDGALLILTTALGVLGSAFGDDATADGAWTSATFQHGEILLGAGTYSLTVQGDGVGGLPAGFYTRLDTAAAVPLPATLPLLLAGFAAFGAVARRRNRRA